MTKSPDKERAISLAISQIEKEFGKGSIMKLGADGKVKDVPAISTGSLALDVALGVGGIPGAGSRKFMARNRPERPP